MALKQWTKRKTIFFYNKIVKEKAPVEYIARGWAIGMFAGCFIPFGLQLLVSVPLSFLMKGSKIGAVFGTLLTNHVTIFIIYPVQCYIGNLIIGGKLSYANIESAMQDVIKNQDFATLFALGSDLVLSFFIGGALLAAVMTPITYFGVIAMVDKYRKIREEKRQARRNRFVASDPFQDGKL